MTQYSVASKLYNLIMTQHSVASHADLIVM
jgi:hypothetical protein